jgi:hypothetical protein
VATKRKEKKNNTVAAEKKFNLSFKYNLLTNWDNVMMAKYFIS